MLGGVGHRYWRRCEIGTALTELLRERLEAPGAWLRETDAAIYNRNFAAAEHLIKRGAQLTLPAALCLGRWSDIERLAASATLGEKQDAFVQAAMNRQAEALRRMLALGAEVVCLICGTSLTFMTSSEANAGDVTVCTFDHPEGIVPEDHTWVEDRLPWIRLADGLPVYDRNRRCSES